MARNKMRSMEIEYVDKILKRFENPYINDDVIRVERELPRRLSAQDGLIKSLLNSKSYTYNLIIGLSAEIRYEK